MSAPLFIDQSARRHAPGVVACGVPLPIVVCGSLIDRAEQFAAQVGSVPQALEVATTNFVRLQSPAARHPERLADKIERAIARPLWTASTEWMPGFEAAQRQFGVSLHERFGTCGKRHAIAALAPDIISIARTQRPGKRIPAGPLGCTSLSILPTATTTGGVLFGRAHDLAGAAPSLSQLVLHVPQKGIAHLSLHTGGAFHPGFSAVNERGLCVGVHPSATSVVRRDGVSIAAIAARLIESAATLDDAIAQLATVPAATAAAFSLAQGKRAAVVEVDGGGRGALLLPPRRHLAVGLPLRTRKNMRAFSPTELDREQGWARLARLNQWARATTAHTRASLAAALGDDKDAYEPHGKRAFGNTVFDLCQAGAFVVDTASDVLVLADGNAKAEQWRELSLSALFAQQPDVLKQWSAQADAYDPPPLEIKTQATAFDRLTPSAREADRPRAMATALAATAARNLILNADARLDAAAELLEEAHALDDKEPLHSLALAQVQLRRGDIDAVEPLCVHVVDRESSPYRNGLACFLARRTALLRGDRASAAEWKSRSRELIWGAHPRLQRRVDRLSAFGARAPLAFHPASADVVG